MSTVVTLGTVGFKPTGAYDNTREYKKLDVVIYQGSSYVAKSDSIGQLPTNTTYWELLVQKGDTGNGITSIAKTSTSGLVDTYTITYTDGTTSTFTVTNGEKGDPGEVTEEQLDEAMARANMVYNALPKVSDEGDSLTLDGTANCPMKMELKGNTEQTTYTGKNLFDNVYGQTENVYTTHINANNPLGSVNCYPINLLPNTQYTLKVDMNGYQKTGEWIAGICFENGNVISLLQVNSMADITTTTFTTDSTGIVYVGQRYGFTYGTTGRMNLFLQTAKIQINEGPTATSYEPYVGGTPSPNPDYPQDVRVVTGNNSVNVIGKNLLDKDNVRDGYRITQDGYYAEAGYSATEIINVKPNTTYSTSWTMFWGACVCTYDKNDNFSRRIQNGTSFTTTSTEYYIRACVENNILSTAQIEIGSSSSSYQPYQSQTYPINLGTMELCKIPNTSYQDIIFHAINGDSFYDTLDNATKQTLTYGKWYKHSEIGKVVLDGSENWSSRAFPDNSYLSVKRTLQVGANGGYCDNFTNNNQYDIVEEHITLNKQWNEICFAILKSRLSTPDGIGFKNWLSTHNTTAYYILATPTNEEITDTTLISQLNAIENAVSYDTQTNIVQENYSEPFIINAECVRSLKDIFELID